MSIRGDRERRTMYSSSHPEPGSSGCYRDPTPEQLSSPEFEAVWREIKSWDVNAPKEYEGYCHSTGNHAAAVLNALDRAGLAVVPKDPTIGMLRSMCALSCTDSSCQSEMQCQDWKGRSGNYADYWRYALEASRSKR
jgi:hypothetical protein